VSPHLSISRHVLTKKRVPHFPKVNLFSTGRSKAGNATLSSEEQELIEPFAPSFVYPIFGEEETIFGYQGLNIDVCLSLPLNLV
jgi:hypothetical protein